MKNNLDLLQKPLFELLAEANKLREKYHHDQLDLCTIFNAKSGACTEDCKFCAQSCFHKTNIDIYDLKTEDEMITAAKRAKEIGSKRFGIVTSGNSLNDDEIDLICRIIQKVKSELNLEVCASLGALNLPKLKKLKSAGLNRYHHNIETSPNFYRHIVSTHKFEERINTVKAVKKAGLECCSGGIIGLGESWEDRISMAETLKELNIDAVPINFLIPIAGTALENQKSISIEDALRTIAIFRIILKNKVIKVAAGRETFLKDFQGMAFMAGANGMLIGGYLTVKGRSPEEDQKLISQIKELWMK